MDESTLRVHEIELAGESGPSLCDSGRVGQHADGAVDLGEITVGNHLGRLVADTNLESSGAPVNELDGALGLEVGNGGMGVLGNDIATVQQTGSHIFTVAGVALDHLVVRFEAGVGDLHDRVGFMGGLGGGDNRSVGNQREVDTWVGHEISLELVQIDVQGTIEAQRGGNGRDD